MPDTVRQLGHDQIIPSRSFTDPEWCERDRTILQGMARDLRRILREEEPSELAGDLDIFYLSDEDGIVHRVVVVDWFGLMETRPLTVVGFFGLRREGADIQVTQQIDAALLEQFTAEPDLLSYSSRQLPDSQWCNLVLFRSPEGIEHWSSNSLHRKAAQDISPRYYDSIRLHNGWLSGGLWSGESIRLARTKYYDFRDQQFWHAVREFRQ